VTNHFLGLQQTLADFDDVLSGLPLQNQNLGGDGFQGCGLQVVDTYHLRCSLPREEGH